MLALIEARGATDGAELPFLRSRLKFHRAENPVVSTSGASRVGSGSGALVRTSLCLVVRQSSKGWDIEIPVRCHRLVGHWLSNDRRGQQKRESAQLNSEEIGEIKLGKSSSLINQISYIEELIALKREY